MQLYCSNRGYIYFTSSRRMAYSFVLVYFSFISPSLSFSPSPSRMMQVPAPIPMRSQARAKHRLTSREKKIATKFLLDFSMMRSPQCRRKPKEPYTKKIPKLSSPSSSAKVNTGHRRLMSPSTPSRKAFGRNRRWRLCLALFQPQSTQYRWGLEVGSSLL